MLDRQTRPANTHCRPATAPCTSSPAGAAPPPAAGDRLVWGAELAQFLATTRPGPPQHPRRTRPPGARAATHGSRGRLHTARTALATARARVLAAAEQPGDLDQTPIWRPSRWKTQPHLEQHSGRQPGPATRPTRPPPSRITHAKRAQQLTDVENWVKDHTRHIARHRAVTTALTTDLDPDGPPRPPNGRRRARPPTPLGARRRPRLGRLAARASQYRTGNGLAPTPQALPGSTGMGPTPPNAPRGTP